MTLQPLPLHLGPWSLEESVARMMMSQSGRTRQRCGHLVQRSDDSGPSVPGSDSFLVLYLCAENAEIGDGQKLPRRPTPIRTKSGFRIFPPDQPTKWDVGVRLGAALRKAYHAIETAGTGQHAGPRPHVRRAHWHGFRSGAMKREDGSPIPADERSFKLRWLPPIPVNLDDLSEP